MHTIRQATITDLPTIRHLWLLGILSEEYPENQAEDADIFTRSIAMALTMEDPLAYVFLAEVDGEPIGYTVYEIQERAIGEPKRYAFGAYMYVAPEHRRSGVATDLAEVAVAHGMSRGLTHLELNVTPGYPGDLFHRSFMHQQVSLRLHTTGTKFIAAIDHLRQRQEMKSRANGQDHDPPLTAPLPAEKE